MTTGEGFIDDSPILTRSGIFLYRNADGSIRREYRPPEEVFKQSHLDSMKAQPIVEDHPGMVTSENVKQHIVGTCLSAGRQDADGVRADIRIYDTTPIGKGKKELSLGYTLDLIEQPGEINGARYDAIQTNMKVNHIALVAKGRAGNARLNMDAAEAVIEEERNTMTDTTVQVRLDSGISYPAAPEVAHEIEKLRQDAEKTASTVETLTKERDAAKGRADALDADLQKAKENEAKIRQDAMQAAMARIELETTAKALEVEFKADAADVDIQKAVIAKVHGDKMRLDGKSDDYVRAAFDMAVTEHNARQDAIAGQRKAIDPQSQTGQARQDGFKSLSDVREDMIKQRQGAWEAK